MFVKPARPDLTIPFPGRRRDEPLKAEGEEVAEESYWLRALRRGDVVRVDTTLNPQKG